MGNNCQQFENKFKPFARVGNIKISSGDTQDYEIDSSGEGDDDVIVIDHEDTLD
jgi:hypothetical protein